MSPRNALIMVTIAMFLGLFAESIISFLGY